MKIPFADIIFRVALRILCDYEDARDVTQDVLEKLIRKNNDVNQYKSLEAFSVKMTKDLCLDRLKHKQIKNEKHKLLQDNYIDEYQNHDNENLVEITKELINRLPDKQRIVIHLRDIEGYEFDEIIAILEMDINAIRMNLSRARKTVKDQLEKICNHGL